MRLWEFGGFWGLNLWFGSYSAWVVLSVYFGFDLFCVLWVLLFASSILSFVCCFGYLVLLVWAGFVVCVWVCWLLFPEWLVFNVFTTKFGV